MFTPAERRGEVRLEFPAPCHREGFCCLLSPSKLLLTPGSEENPIAWLVAIWPPIVLGTSRGKGVAQGQGGLFCAPQAFPPNRLSGVSVHWPGQVGLGGVRVGWNARIATVVRENGQKQVRKQCCCILLPLKCHGAHQHNSGSPNPGWCGAHPVSGLRSWLLRLPLVSFQGRSGAGSWGTVTDTGLCALARSHLCMPSWGQDTVAVLTFQAEAVPVLAQGAHLLRCREEGGTRLAAGHPPYHPQACSVSLRRWGVSRRPAPSRQSAMPHR